MRPALRGGPVVQRGVLGGAPFAPGSFAIEGTLIHPPGLATRARPRHHARRVYLGSFSKTAAPGMRVGFLLGHTALVRRFVMAKQAADLQINTLGKHLLLRFFGDPSFEEHVAMLRRVYRGRRDALDHALRGRLAEGEGRDTLRLNFSHCTEERLEEGVARLGRARGDSVTSDAWMTNYGPSRFTPLSSAASAAALSSNGTRAPRPASSEIARTVRQA